MVLCDISSWRELGTELFGTLGEVVHNPLAVPLLVIILTFVGVFLALGQHRVDEAGKLVSSGGNRFGLIQSGTLATKVGSQ